MIERLRYFPDNVAFARKGRVSRWKYQMQSAQARERSLAVDAT